MKNVKALEDSNILLKGVTEKIKNERTKRRMSKYVIRYLLGNLLAGKGILGAGSGRCSVNSSA